MDVETFGFDESEAHRLPDRFEQRPRQAIGHLYEKVHQSLQYKLACVEIDDAFVLEEPAEVAGMGVAVPARLEIKRS